MSRDIEAPARSGYPCPDGRTLTGRLCRLERLHPDHASGLHAVFAEDDWDYLPYGPFPNGVAFDSWLRQSCLGGDPLFYAVMVAGRPAGMAALMRIMPRHGVVEIGHIHYGLGLKGSAAATEAMLLLMTHIFEDLGYRRYEWKCNAANAPSRRAAERLGFTPEGVFRQHMVVKGRNRDTAWFSMLDHEWPDRKERLTRWLAPENFDVEGRQIRSITSL